MRTITRKQLTEAIEAGIARTDRRRINGALAEDSIAALRAYAQTADYAVVGTFAEVPIPGDETRRCGCPVTAAVRPLHEPNLVDSLTRGGNQYLAEVDFARGYDNYVKRLHSDWSRREHVLQVID